MLHHIFERQVGSIGQTLIYSVAGDEGSYLPNCQLNLVAVSIVL